MSHRLLSTIVFTSTSLLGCGTVDGAKDAAIDASFSDATQKDASISDATIDTVKDVQADIQDAQSDARLCEPGWPTTKGAMCVLDASILCCEVKGDEPGIECCEK